MKGKNKEKFMRILKSLCEKLNDKDYETLLAFMEGVVFFKMNENKEITNERNEGIIESIGSGGEGNLTVGRKA